jgi:hypothetical protein
MATGMSEGTVTLNNAQRAIVKEKQMFRKIPPLWNRIRDLKNWESRMGLEYFLLIALGSLIVGLMSG